MAQSSIRKHVPATCQQCGGNYQRRSDDKERKYCSNQCRGRAKTQSGTILQECEGCKQPFRVSKSQSLYRPRQHCSLFCRKKHFKPSSSVQAILDLRDQGLSYSEIAGITGKTYGYVRSTWWKYRSTEDHRRAIREQRQSCLQGECVQCGRAKKHKGSRCGSCVARSSRQRLKSEVFAAYGNKCACCGEAQIEFLTLDHIHNDGAEHRRSLGIGVGAGRNVYADVKRQNFPKDRFQLLCWNCNCAKQHFGTCPHQQQKADS